MRIGKKRIIMIGTSINTQGGISTVLSVLESGGLFNRNHVELITSHQDGSIFTKLCTAYKGFMRFIVFLYGGRISILHVHVASRASFWRKTLFILASFAFRVPVIVHLHGAEFGRFYGEESSPLVKRLIRFVFEKAARVIVLSNSWREWAVAAFPRARVVTIYNPVVLPKESPRVTGNVGTVLFLGRLCNRKGALDLIEAIALLKDRFPDVKLLMGGDGDLQSARKLAEELDIADRIELLGWVRGDEKKTLLCKAGVYVLPSYFEGLPMSVLEAMAAGIPIISTPVGGIAEAVTDGVEGFLVQPGDVSALADRIARLLEDSTLNRQMGNAARRKVEITFSVELIIPLIEGLYAELGAGPSA
jgi:glycosyltransferase involved in cell wall biosynthesis